MKATRYLPNLGYAMLTWMISISVYAATTDISSVPLNTYTATSSADVKPNVLYILDDSGSMGWDYLPDWANDNSPPGYYYKNSSFNGVAYNPAIKYTPPVTYNSDGTLNSTKYPSMTGSSAATGGDSAATSASPNWKAVPNDGFGVQSTATSNLVNNAYSYTSIAGEYCSAVSFRTCTPATSQTTISSVVYKYPAILRWCNSSALTTCKATNDGTYNNPRMAIPRTATITVNGTSSTSVSGITVNGQQIMSGTAAASTTSSTVASNIATQINLCSNSIAGNCQVVGYTATVSGSVVTIFAPATISYTPVVTQSGSMTITPTAFVAGTVPGENLRTTITSSVTSYPYPGSSSKAAGRSDCAGTSCTYAEEMTNYANWWAYYHTRMQMMKSAASQAFSKLDSPLDISNNVSRYRVGYMSLNNNQGSGFLNLGEFKTSQKSSWYSKFLAANPGNSTPLRATLADAGRLYAGKLNGSSYKGVTVSDPLQYSCQQNYTILSTDGFWNGGAGYKMDGSTAVGNQDAALPRPLADGASVTVQASTSSLQSRTTTQTAQLGTLQTRSGTLQGTLSKVLMVCNNTTAVCGSAPATGIANANWSVVTSGTCTTGAAKQCAAISGLSGNVNVATSCNTTGTISTTAVSTGTMTLTVSGTISNSNKSSLSSIKINGVEILTGTTSSGGSTSSVASNIQSKVGSNGFTASVSGSVVTVSSSQIVTGSTMTYTVATGGAVLTPLVTSSGSTKYTLSNADSNGNVYSACPYNWAAWTNAAAACSINKSTANTYTIKSATDCQYALAATAGTATCSPAWVANNYTNLTVYQNCSSSSGTWTNAASCTATTTPDVNGQTTNCQYTTWSAYSNVGSCTPVAQSTSPNYTVGTARRCTSTSSGGTSDTLADVAAYYYGTDLRSSVAANGTGTCTGPIISPSTTANDLCADNVPTFGRDVATTQHMTTFTLGLGAQGEMVFSPTYWSDSSGDFYDVWKGTTANPTNGICAWQTSGQCNWPTPASDSLNNIDDLWHTAINGRGSYFSATDPLSLATGLSNTLSSISNTPKPGTAAAAASSNPNISTSDNFVFSSSYKSVDWYGEIIRQQLDVTSVTLTAPQWSAMTLLDCATTPWAATTSYLVGQTYSNGSNCYTVAADYASGATFGTLDTDNTARIVDASGVDVAPMASRNIYTLGSGGITPFTWSNLSATQQAYFTEPAISYVSSSIGLSQFCVVGACLSATAQTNNTIATGGAAGEALVNFLRGDRSNEGSFYRTRVHVLGDIVTSEGRYVKQSLFNYTDTNFAAYKTLMASRAGTVYVAANDGMLHAFNADTGQERWAYVPGVVLPKMYRLADKNYTSQHEYFVDGTPEVGDICPSAPGTTCSSTQWRTILVGGLNYGGKGFYALDITDPVAPTVLWEISSSTPGFSNLGYSYSNPRITKLKNGTWVVIFASGYNNADGVGHVYVVNAGTGALISDISNSFGSVANPSGLARISAHAPNSDTDNTTTAVYGGDLYGNLWRFDINGDIGAPGIDAQLLITLVDASGTPQPITAKPTVTTITAVTGGVSVDYPVIFVGTGKYLGTTDLSATSPQSQAFYAVKDTLTTNVLGNPRNAVSGFVKQMLTATTCPLNTSTSVCIPGQQVNTISSNPVDWGTQNGWYFDFLTPGERAATDSSLGLGTLVFTTITPHAYSADPCNTSGGSISSFSYAVNYLTGGAVPGSNGVAGASLGSGAATRPVLVELPDGTVLELIRMSGGVDNSVPPTPGGTSTGGSDMGDTNLQKPTINNTAIGTTRRVSWRKLPL
jgi:type IV pilus assembly protein PilY1